QSDYRHILDDNARIVDTIEKNKGIGKRSRPWMKDEGFSTRSIRPFGTECDGLTVRLRFCGIGNIDTEPVRRDMDDDWNVQILERSPRRARNRHQFDKLECSLEDEIPRL